MYLDPYAKKGKALAFLYEHINHQGDDCLPWPFFVADDGYGSCSVSGQLYRAHHVMCRIVHGPKPTRKHEAAHECGNPSCVNPRHLTWKTRKENAADMVRHGTAPKSGRKRRKLTDEQVVEIRALKGQKTLREIATMFGVNYKTVSKIQLGQTRTINISAVTGAA